MKMFRRSLLWMMVLAVPASVLLLLPLRAQEAAPTPAPEPVKADELPPDERVSADNNLSFPVDI
jgi:hypothetical protein